MFNLHPRLEADTFPIGDLPLSRLLLMNDSRYPWIILVPRIDSVNEMHHLNDADRQQLMKESCLVAEFIENNFSIDKMNVGVLGNIVAQLHMHHIGRSINDPAWPGPVWGHSAAVPYVEEQAQALIDKCRKTLESNPSA
ncbi:MAG: HIT domain-containing protein [Gammaproteobacteria bacterium]|nr:HIT domain-containing protein [Gammaproteobacteria bacterium]